VADVTLPIPVDLLPVPRLIVWHGDPETDADLALLAVLRRAYYGVLGHGLGPGRTAGGNDWSGWHLPDAGAIAGLADVARAFGPSHWTIVEDVLPRS
jgi:hypothetical protein